MNYLVINLSDFSVLKKPMFDEEYELSTVEVFSCPTTAKIAADKLSMGVVVIAVRDIDSILIPGIEMLQQANQRVQDLLKENESLKNQLK